jgi:hypothetical protein
MGPYLTVVFFSLLAPAVVWLPDSWIDLHASERYVLGAALLVAAAILLINRARG